MQLGLLYGGVLGLPGLAYLFASLLSLSPHGQLLGLLFWISLGVRGPLRLVACGRSMTSSFRWCSPSAPIFSEGIWAALGAGDVSCAWRIWSQAAEVSLRSAFQLLGEPSPTRVSNVVVESLVVVIFIVLVGPVVGKTLADFADHEDGQFDLYGSW